MVASCDFDKSELRRNANTCSDACQFDCEFNCVTQFCSFDKNHKIEPMTFYNITISIVYADGILSNSRPE